MPRITEISYGSWVEQDEFMVMLDLWFVKERVIVHMKVRRIDGKDGITWDDLQRIKNEFMGQDVIMYEVYPAERDLINHGNIRHLWEAVDRESVANLNTDQ